MNLYEAVTEHFRGSSHADCEKQLNEYLNAKPITHRCNSIQQLKTDSRLATESTFEWSATYLILWERIK